MWRIIPILLLSAIAWFALGLVTQLAGGPRAGAALAAGAALYFIIAWLLERLFMKAVTAPFKMKGAILRGARAEIHAVERIDPAGLPAGGDEDEDEKARPAGAWRVEATITPNPPAGGPFTHWSPSELQLVGFMTRCGPDDPSSDDLVDIRKVEILEEGRWIDDEGMKYPGPLRVRLACSSAKAPVGRVKFRYYFETFGDLSLG